MHEPHVFCTLSHAYGFVHLHVPSTHERPCLVSHTIFKLHLPFNVVAFVVFLLNGKIKKIILLKKTIKTILFLNRCDHRWERRHKDYYSFFKESFKLKNNDK